MHYCTAIGLVLSTVAFLGLFTTGMFYKVNDIPQTEN
jgi:hypothetical protein